MDLKRAPLLLLPLLFVNASSSGILFVPQEEVVFVTGHWIINVDLATTQLDNALSELNNQCNIFKAFYIQNQAFPEIYNISQEYEAKLRFELSHVQKEFQSAVGNPNSKRNSRGLFNAIGYGLNYITGTATNDQIEQLQEQIAQVSEQTNNSKFLSNVTATLKRHDDMLTQTRKALTLLGQTINNNENQMEEEIRKIEQANKIFTLTHLAYTSINRHIEEINSDVAHTKEMIEFAGLGHLTHSILSPAQLNQIVKKAASDLPKHISFAGYANQNIFNLYHHAKVSVLLFLSSTRIVVSLPLYDIKHSFQLYQAHSFPSLQTGTDHAVLLKPDTEYLAVSGNNESFIKLNTDFVKTCSRGEILVCPLIHPIHFPPSQSCSISTFLNDNDGITKHCQVLFINSPYVLFIHGEDVGKWHYSVSNSTSLLLTCNQKTSKFTVSGHGFITVPDGCSVTDSNTILYGPPYTHTSNLRIQPSVKITQLLPLNMPMTSEIIFDTANSSTALKTILESISMLDTHNVPVISAAEVKRNVRLLRPLHNQVTFLNFTGITVGGVLTAGLITIIICRLVNCLKSNSNHSTSNAPSAVVTVIPHQQELIERQLPVYARNVPYFSHLPSSISYA